MKSIFKRSLSVFMAIIMLWSVMTVAGFSAFATEGVEGDSSEITTSDTTPSSEIESGEAENGEAENSSSSETGSSENQQESSSSVPESSDAPEETEPASTNPYKGVDVTFKSSQGLFEDVTKTYQQGEVFEIAINWRSNNKITCFDMNARFDCEGLEVLYQDINTTIKSATGNIDKELQVSDNMVTFIYGNYKGSAWNEMDYIVKYKVKVLADVGSKQTMTVDFRDVVFLDANGEDEFYYIATKSEEDVYGEVLEEYKGQYETSLSASEPQTPYKKYTMIGNINGKDVGFEGDAQTIVSEYNFVKGKVTVSFDSNTGKVSYVVGEDVYNNGENSESSDAEAPTKNVYRVVGSGGLCMTEQDPEDEHNNMIYAGDGIYKKVYTNIAPGEYEFKVYENYDKKLGDQNIIYGEDGVGSDSVKLTVGNTATVKIPFTRESYVFVKTVNTEPVEWFMFNEYNQDTTGTLYNTKTGSKEKMKVPAGYVTFTLAENEDGTLSLSYEVDTTVVPTEPYVPKEYTIVGHINGEDVGFDNDAHVFVPDYNFVDGKVTIIFDEDSYVFVKTTNNENWYMSEGYCAETSCVMYDTTVNQLTDANKLYVPSGKAIFTLTENEDGTITLSYEMDTEYTPVLIDKEYTLVGNINGKDVGCEEDYENVVEEYNFVKGSVTIEFTEESYVFVKTTDNANWYMFPRYIDDDITGTLFNTVTGTKEKMLIPAGKYTLVLSETGKDRLRLSYVPYEEPTEPTIPSESEETEPSTVKPTTPKKPAFKVTKKTLKAGQKYTLKVANASGKKVSKWSSSNTKVATVSSKGVVTALGKGKATISATVGGTKIKCTITVSSSPKIYNGKKAVKNNKTIKVKKGKTLKLTIKGKASGVNNIYKTSKKKIAKVTSKKSAKTVKVKAYRRGTAKITITVNKKYKTTIKVKVV